MDSKLLKHQVSHLNSLLYGNTKLQSCQHQLIWVDTAKVSLNILHGSSTTERVISLPDFRLLAMYIYHMLQTLVHVRVDTNLTYTN